MPTTIWKTVLRPADLQQIEVPAGAELLCAREQYEQIAVWFRCNPENPKETRTIAVVGTGSQAADVSDSRYLGTASLHGGQLMFHVFEKTRNGDHPDEQP